MLLNNIQSGGNIWLTIVGNSMFPFIMDGDRVLIKDEDFEKLKCGDVITYRINNNYITHRIIHKFNGYLLTKGDHLYFPDHYIERNSFVGKVIIIERKNKKRDLNQRKYRIMNWFTGYIQRIIGSINLYIYNKCSSKIQRKIAFLICKISNKIVEFIERIVFCG